MNEFIKATLTLALEKFDRIYIHCAPFDEVFIGNRGFVGAEQKDGIMLSFSATSCKSLKIEDEGVMAELRFGGTWENVFIPLYAIDAIIDDLQNPSFVFNFMLESYEIGDKNKIETDKPEQTAEILKLDFTKRKK